MKTAEQILRQLVELKYIKDKYGKTTFYEANKEGIWKDAKQCVDFDNTYDFGNLEYKEEIYENRK